MSLAKIIHGEIAERGPMRLDRYMSLCLMHPEFGYYTRRDPFGTKGDFVTAPEVSQMFGEMIGLWLAQVWQDQNLGPTTLVELGPGRGTLIADILRVCSAMPGPADALSVRLIEQSPHLKALQASALKWPRLSWSTSIADLPDGPILLIANEFFDAMPIRQAERIDALWLERVIHSDGKSLRMGHAPLDAPTAEALPNHARDGEIVEWSDASKRIIGRVGAQIANQGGAALIVDYGSDGGVGDTLQAVKEHDFHSTLNDPGNADLSAHVDFGALATAAAPAHPAPLFEQGTFLANLGIGQRAQQLAQQGDANAVADALERLTEPKQMGSLFKVLGIRPPGSSPTPRTGGTMLNPITSPSLEPVRHGFFTRLGGVSEGIYSTLNCGPGSSDDPAAVTENRSRVAGHFALPGNHLISLHQVHSAKAVHVTGTFDGVRPKADAMVTATPGIALGVLSADCAPILFADPQNHVIAAAHSGWRGTLAGIGRATVDAMIAIGAARENIQAVIGPTISQRAYEVGPEFFDDFLAEDQGNARFFAGGTGDRMMFDLPSFILDHLRATGIKSADWTGDCTFSDEERLFSYRRTTHRKEADYGRQISVITL